MSDAYRQLTNKKPDRDWKFEVNRLLQSFFREVSTAGLINSSAQADPRRLGEKDLRAICDTELSPDRDPMWRLLPSCFAKLALWYTPSVFALTFGTPLEWSRGVVLGYMGREGACVCVIVHSAVLY